MKSQHQKHLIFDHTLSESVELEMTTISKSVTDSPVFLFLVMESANPARPEILRKLKSWKIVQL